MRVDHKIDHRHRFEGLRSGLQRSDLGLQRRGRVVQDVAGQRDGSHRIAEGGRDVVALNGIWRRRLTFTALLLHAAVQRLRSSSHDAREPGIHTIN